MSPPTMVIAAAQPTKVVSSADSKGLVSTGQLSTLLPNPSDVTNVLESMKRISDAKYARRRLVQRVPGNAALNAAALGATGIAGLRLYQGGVHRRPVQQSRGGESGRGSEHRRRERHLSAPRNIRPIRDYQKTAAIMKLVIDGNAAAGTIEMGGFDYHSGDRMDGEARDFNLGNCIGAVLGVRQARRQARHDLCLQRRLAGQQRHDRQLGRRTRQGRVDGGQPKRRGDLFPGLQPGRQGAVPRRPIRR